MTEYFKKYAEPENYDVKVYIQLESQKQTRLSWNKLVPFREFKANENETALRYLFIINVHWFA